MMQEAVWEVSAIAARRAESQWSIGGADVDCTVTAEKLALFQASSGQPGRWS